MKYNIIGDFHVRKEALSLFNPEYINVFLGDYFDPYHPFSFDYIKEQFLEVLKLKEQHPATILLLGNHDVSYLLEGDITNRTDRKHFYEIRKLLTDNLDKFQIVYNIEDKYICTHAGISVMWYLKYIHDEPITNFYDLSEFDNLNKKEALQQIKRDWNYSSTDPKMNDVIFYNNVYYIYIDKWIPIVINLKEICSDIQDLFKNNIQAFSFSNNAIGWDTYGTSKTQSPIWIRPGTLEKVNLFRGTDIKQIVGHTMYEYITISNGIIYCDCLEYNLESFKIEI